MKSAKAELKQLQTELSECNSNSVKYMQSLIKFQEEQEIAKTEVEEAEENLEDAKNYKEIAKKKFAQFKYSESKISNKLNLITIKLENLKKEDNFNYLNITLTDQIEKISNDEILYKLHSGIKEKSKIQVLEIEIEAKIEWIKQLKDKRKFFFESECKHENNLCVESTKLESAKKNSNLNHNVLYSLIDFLREKDIYENIKHQIHEIENDCSTAEKHREKLDISYTALTKIVRKTKKKNRTLL